MNYQELEARVEATPQKKPSPVGHSSANEEKLKELEDMIDAELLKEPVTRKGCFGKLVRLTNGAVCKACTYGRECETELLKNGVTQMLEAEAEIESIILDNQLNRELIQMTNLSDHEIETHPILKQIHAAAAVLKDDLTTEPNIYPEPKPEPIAVTTTKKVNEVVAPKPIEYPGIDISDLGKRCKVAFDFNKAKDMILTEQPKDWKRVRAICLSLVDDTYWHGATAYGNAKKVMARLAELKVVGWDAKKQEITYAI